LVAERGSPRYFCGKEEMDVPRMVAMESARAVSIFMGTRVVLSKFMERPVAVAKS
jgi:hypothetical protein